MYPVYVGHINPEVQVRDLRNMFSQYGEVLEVTIVSDFGFVTFSRPRDAELAIRRLNGAHLHRQALHVDYSDELSAYLRRKGVRFEFTRDPQKRGGSRREDHQPSRHHQFRERRQRSPPRRPSKDHCPPSSRRHPRDSSPPSRRHSRNSSSPRLQKSQSPPRKALKISASPDSEAEKRRVVIESKQEGQNDLRQVLNCKHPQKVETLSSSSLPQLQEIRVDQLFCEVEEEDLRRLFSSYGFVHQVKITDTSAKIILHSSLDEVEAAVRNLNGSLWMDNNITVTLLSQRPESSGQSVSAPNDQPSQQDVKVSNVERTVTNSQIKARTLMIYSNSNSKTFEDDMKELFKGFGKVLASRMRSIRGENVVLLDFHSSEKQAVRCVSSTNKLHYKGSRLYVKFETGSEEDEAEFREKYKYQLQDYPAEMFKEPETTETEENINGPSSTSDVPLGVLPPSSSLGGFGAKPDMATLQEIIKNVKAVMGPASTLVKDPPLQSASALSSTSKSDKTLFSVEGEIYSMHNRIVLIKFSHQGSMCLAKLVPGQMYLNGHVSLGYVIKNNTFHAWPQSVKDCLYQGAKIRFDATRMTEVQVAETAEITNEKVLYNTTFVYKHPRPDQSELLLCKKQDKTSIFKARVTTLFPKWGVLTNAKGQDIFFSATTYLSRSGPIAKDDSLLHHLSLGDLLAVHCTFKDYLEMAEIARNYKGFSSGTENLFFLANLAWPINSEIDPYFHLNRSSERTMDPVRFLATTNTLNCQLPVEKEATHNGWPGVIEEIHIPSGGVVLLDENLGLDPQQRRVYFHRSRVYLNGIKIDSNTSLKEELALGDAVTVNVLMNKDPTWSFKYVTMNVFWVALTLQLSNRGRGQNIAKTLRVESHGKKQHGPHEPTKARIIHFNRPEDPNGPVTSGKAVIQTGRLTGQKIDFEASQCIAFGVPLDNADLSMIFREDDDVNIEVKPYNAFIVDCLYVGFKETITDEDEANERTDHFYLAARGLDIVLLKQIAAGSFGPRPFLPLRSPCFQGRVRNVSSEKLLLEVDLGLDDWQEMSVNRTRVFVFGHWMGKADLRYIFHNELVCVEYSPMCDGSEPSLVWLATPEDRPYYQNAGNRSVISAGMDQRLWEFVKSKNMDAKMFRAVVDANVSNMDMKLMPLSN